MKKYQGVLGLGLTALTLSMAAGQVAFTAGNLVVLQAGEDNGAVALTSAATKLFLKEIDITDGHVVQTIPVPFTAALSGNRAVCQSGSATSEGFMHLSADGKRLLFVGYNADAGTLAVATTASATNERVVGVVDCSGVVNSTTALTDAYTGGNIRGATSSNGTDIWVSGNGAANATGLAQSGIRYATLGGTTTVALQDNGGTLSPPGNTRSIGIFAGDLYFSSASGSYLGVAIVGSGLPTTSGQLPILLNGFPQTGGTAVESAYDFYFADANTLYVCNDNTIATNGGLQKWTQSAGAWTLQYTLSSGLNTTVGVRCLTGKTTAGVSTLYITTAGGTAGANSILSLVDTGAASAFSAPLATSTANAWWRGIAFAPTGCTGGTCYAH